MFESHRVLHRYLLHEYLKVCFLSLSSLILIYMVVLFFEKIDLFIKHKASFLLMLEYLLYKIPEVIFQWTLPYAVLLSTLLTLGTLSRHSEIAAMKAGGVSIYRITFPLFIIALLISFFSFMGNEYLVPLANQKTQHLLAVKVKNQPQTSFFKNYKIWYHGESGIFNIQLLDATEKALKGFTFYQFDDQFRCTQRVDAREARWVNGKWRLYQGALRKFKEGGSIHTLPFKELEFSLPETWESFQSIERKSKEMSCFDLLNYIRKIQSSGYDSTRYWVDFYSKLSNPFLNLIMVLIGIPFALKTGRSGGMALGIGISVIIGFVYGVTFYVFLFFGKSGVLPPFLAAWTPTLLFGLAGIFTLTNIRQ